MFSQLCTYAFIYFEEEVADIIQNSQTNKDNGYFINLFHKM